MDALKLFTVTFAYSDDVLSITRPADVADVVFSDVVHDLMPFMISVTTLYYQTPPSLSNLITDKFSTICKNAHF